MIRAKKALIAVAILAPLLVWLLVFSGLFAIPRGLLAAQFLSSRLGQNLSIDGGVDVTLDPELQIVAHDLTVAPSTAVNFDKVNIKRIGFALDWRSVLRRDPRFSDVHIDGAHIEIRAGANTDAKPSAADIAPHGRTGAALSPHRNDLKKLVSDGQITFSDFEFLYENAQSGIDLDLQLSSMTLAQGNANAAWSLQGKGGLNGQAVTVDGSFPADAPFKVTADTDQINLRIDGTPGPDGYASGYTANFAMEIGKLAQFLDILRLQKSVSGTGNVSATFKSSSGKRSVDDLNVQLTLNSGQSLDLAGNISSLQNLNDATLTAKIGLYPSDGMPPPAKMLRDLKLTGFEMQLTAQPDGIPLRQMKVQTNGFVLHTHGKGPPPITVSKIRITPDGLLDLGKVGLRIGPPGAYFVVFDGSVGDALRVKGIDLDATVDLPLVVFARNSQPGETEGLGKVVGGFHLSGDGEALALSDLDLKSQGSDLLQIDATASSDNVLALSDVSLDVTADVPSGAKVLSALKLPSLPVGEVKLDAKLSNDGQGWQSETQFAVDQSKLDISVSAETDPSNPLLDGQITSPLIRLQDVRHVIDLVREIAPAHRDKPKSGQLVSDVTLEPVMSQILQSGVEMDVKIDLEKLEGVAGTSDVKTEFTLKQESAQLGPVKFAYDGGRFDVTGSVDLGKDPDIVAVKGSADGWNFGTILQELNFKKAGSGILNATFDLAGHHNSIKEFASTASGNILISMQHGRIHTRLLNLAGLGVLPWLFSDAHGKVEPIDCLRAPLWFDHGNITIKEAVLETDKVQVVTNGDVNLRKQTIDVTGEPRPLGKPMARSPWPFVVSGSLKHPRFQLKQGSHRQHRADGASTMPTQRKPCVADILQLR